MKVVVVALAILVAPGVVSAATVGGRTFATTVRVEGRPLKLIGAGIRERWMIDVYAFGAYSESGACEADAIVDAEEVKYLRLDMLRDVGAERIASSIGESLDESMPEDASAELRRQRRIFLGYFEDEATEGTVFEFSYVPGTGTILKQDGEELGPPLGGSAFSRLLWSVYFGERTCCEDLREQVLGMCR